MKSQLGHVLWLAIALACGSVLAQDQQPQIRWAPDIATARNASAQFKVPLLVHFYGNNCLPCKTLEERVYSKPELVETLNKFFICVKVNGSLDPKTAAQFQVHSWPTDVFVSPDGKTLYQGVCRQDVRSYMGILEQVAVMNRDRNMMLAAHQQSEQRQAIASQNAQPSLGGLNNSGLPNPANSVASQPQNLLVSRQTSSAVNNQAPVNNSPLGHQPSLGTNPSLGHGQIRTSPAQPNGSYNQSQANVAYQASAGSSLNHNANAPTTLVNQSGPVQGGPVHGGIQRGSLQTGAIQNGIGPAPNALTAQNQATSAPSLGPSLAPAHDVRSGPLTAQQQPTTLHGAVQSSGQLLAGPASPVMNTNSSGHLPPMERSGAAPASITAGREMSPAAYEHMPTMKHTGISVGPATQTVSTTPQAANQVRTRLVGNSRAVPNPYFRPEATHPPVNSQATLPNAALPGVGQPTQTSVAPPANFVSAPTTSASPTLASDTSTPPLPSQTDVENAAPVSAAPMSAGEESTVQTVETPSDESSDDGPALDGYCPVALKTAGSWVKGSEEFAVKHRGKVYWLSNSKAVESFMAAPDDSSPVLSGYDPLVFLEEGRLVPGSIQYGLHEQVSGSYLLFASAEAKKKYWSDFDRYSRALTTVLEKAGAK